MSAGGIFVNDSGPTIVATKQHSVGGETVEMQQMHVSDGTTLSQMLEVKSDGSINVHIVSGLPAGSTNIGDVDVIFSAANLNNDALKVHLDSSNITLSTQESIVNTASANFIVAVSTSAVVGLTSNTSRRSYVLQNFSEGGSNSTIYIGSTSGVTTGSGIAVLDGDSYSDDGYNGNIYIISGSTAEINVRVWERLIN